ncbi:MAG: gliding motility-associated C-terminal domain-containing protein, partial [bacterium]|nr:gliding motility-associated C-terminal domain-containing protein [bacterium]
LDYGNIQVDFSIAGYLSAQNTFFAEPFMDYNLIQKITNESDRIKFIKIHALDSKSNLPVSDVEIVLEPDMLSDKTDLNGISKFTNVIWGEKKAVITKAGYITEKIKFLGEPAEEYSFTVMLRHLNSGEPVFFPVPFKPKAGDLYLNYNNTVAIQIYNIAGDLVYEYTGDSFSWNGKNLSGEPLPSGVYMIIISDLENKLKFQKKIVLVK